MSHLSTHVLPTFPTRRSSDLDADHREPVAFLRPQAPAINETLAERIFAGPMFLGKLRAHDRGALGTKFAEKHWPGENRSEEHTSELQSRPHLVCRLLLEKKKN